MTTQEKQQITVGEWKQGIYSELKSKFNDNNVLEVYVVYGGAAVLPHDKAHNAHLTITADNEKRPEIYRQYKKSILQELPEGSFKLMSDSPFQDAMMLLEVNEQAFDQLYHDPLVTDFMWNAFFEPSG